MYFNDKKGFIVKIFNLRGIHTEFFFFMSHRVTVNGLIFSRVGQKWSELSTQFHDKTRILRDCGNVTFNLGHLGKQPGFRFLTT